MTGAKGQVILDVYARYEDEDLEGTEHRLGHHRYGVTWEALKIQNGAVNGKTVEKDVKSAFAGRVVVVHAIDGDRAAFQYEKAFEGAARIIDTQKLYSSLQSDGTPSLVNCARILLGKTIQGGNGRGDHSPVEDAQTTMEIYLLKNGKKTIGATGEAEVGEDEAEGEVDLAALDARKANAKYKKLEREWLREQSRRRREGGVLGWN